MSLARDPQTDSTARQARAVIRAQDRATLATSQGGWPFASLVMVALDHDVSPLLLISDLSEHAKNIKAERRVSLLFDGTLGLADPLAGPRVTVLGEAAPMEDSRLKARFLARHPSAELYVGFTDFHLHRVSISRAHLVAGFGRIQWVGARDLLVTPDGTFAREEPATLAAVNTDAKMVNAVVQSLGLQGEGWRVTGVDPEGLDFRRGGSTARAHTPVPILGIEAVRAALSSREFPQS